MVRDWDTHLEQAGSLSEEYSLAAEKQYLESVFDVALRSFEKYREIEENTRPDDLEEEDMLANYDPEVLNLMLDEIEKSAEANAYAQAYRDVVFILDDAENVESYEEDMRELIEDRKELSEKNIREIDRYAKLDVPENIPVYIVEDQLDPVLDQVLDKHS